MRLMIGVLAVAVMVFLFAARDAMACKGSEVIFEDGFTTMDPAWGEPSNRQSVRDGKFVIEPEAEKLWSAINQANVFGDMDACVKVTIAKSDDVSWGGGLIFWAKGYDDYYYLLINGDGWFAVRRWTNGRALDPVPWRQNAALKKGVGQTNQLRVVTKGNEATVYINDTQVVSFKGQPPQGGGFIGVIGNAPSVWEFSELKVTKPDAAATGSSASPGSGCYPGQ